MIAYNKEGLDNLYIRKQLSDEFDKGSINKEQYDRCAEEYPVKFYTPNYVIRIGLFILTVVVAVFSFGLMALISSAGSEASLVVLLIFLAIFAYGALEFMVHAKHHYKSGVDDALMWMTGIALVSSFNIWSDVSYLQNAIFIFAVSLCLTLRFNNMLMSGVACVAFLAFLFFTYTRMGESTKASAPFVMMMVSFFIYFISSRNKNQPAFKYYSGCLLITEIVALVCFYAAGNYYVVREASIVVFHLDLKENESIPFGRLFWIFTIVIPLIYLARGIQKKDVLFLRIGLILIPAAVLTVRYYYHILPVEIAITLCGSLMIGFSYFLIRYLRQPHYGITNEQPVEKNQAEIHQLEALVVAQSFGHSKPHSSETPTVTFGGGSGGGGGAGGEF
jgi:hypothetical protein